MNPIARYTRWLHTGVPAGVVETLPVVREDGTTSVPGVYVVGDLRGVPLLKLAADSGAKAARQIAQDPKLREERAASADTLRGEPDEKAAGGGSQVGEPDEQAAGGGGRVLDVVIVGAGVSGMAAALEARARGLDFRILEATEPFTTIVNFPKAKPIYTYPKDLEPEGALKIRADVKEDLVDELREQTLGAGLEPEASRANRLRRRGKLLEVVLADGTTLRARRVILALGRSGDFRRLDVPGEDFDKVYNRLHDPKDYAGRRVLVVGGGDSALETAIALAHAGAEVTLSYRGAALSRPKHDNVEQLEALGTRVRVVLSTRVREIRADDVLIERADGSTELLPNDVVFVMIGREAPLGFFRRSGMALVGERGARFWGTLALSLAFFAFVYHWKAGGALTAWFDAHRWFPFNLPATDPSTLLGTIAISFHSPGAWYSLAYTAAITIFGVRRIRRRRTAYVTAQTATLMAVQILPLFLLPYVILPWAGNRGAFDKRDRVERMSESDVAAWYDAAARSEPTQLAQQRFPTWGRTLVTYAPPASPSPAMGDEAFHTVSIKSSEGPTRVAVVHLRERRIDIRDDSLPTWRLADTLFPETEWDPQGREYWRAFGFILAWPLFLWNMFTDKPNGVWLAISLVQTFVLIPLIVLRWGKGAYCGWICSCGALAETLGDTHRQKMPHGPVWNRLNMTGQVIFAVALVLLVLRVAGWALPWDHPVNVAYAAVLTGKTVAGASHPFPAPLLNYKWLVDLFLAGIVGTGLYFHFSGRVWCRFACPLAAWMHIVARFSRFRILADKKKCISCNVCTSVCHQGIDVMNYANKGAPMDDVECVRCSACVQSCPTGVLTFGGIDRRTGRVVGTDRLVASAVQLREGAR